MDYYQMVFDGNALKKRKTYSVENDQYAHAFLPDGCAKVIFQTFKLCSSSHSAAHITLLQANFHCKEN